MNKLILGLLFVSFSQMSIAQQDRYGPAWVKKCNATSNLAYCENQAKKMSSYESGSVADSARLGAAYSAAMTQTMQAWNSFQAPRNTGKSIAEYTKESLIRAYKDGGVISGIPLYEKYGEDALEDFIKAMKRENYYAIDLLHAYEIKIDFLFDLRPEKNVIKKDVRAAYRLLEEAILLDKKLDSEKEFGLLLTPKLNYLKGLALTNGIGTDKNVNNSWRAFVDGSTKPFETWANDQNRLQRKLKTETRIHPYVNHYITMNLCAKVNWHLTNKLPADTWSEYANAAAVMAGRMMARSRQTNFGPICDSIADLTTLHMDEQKKADESCKKETDRLCDLIAYLVL